MLYILTGDIQIGKTRWLQKTVSILEDMGVGVQGVITPGIWKKTLNRASLAWGMT